MDSDCIEFMGDALPSCIVFDNAMVVAKVKTKLLGFE
jgi:hypothetical protein